MMSRSLLFVMLSLTTTLLLGQSDCIFSQAQAYAESNNIRAAIGQSGSIFWDEYVNAGFTAPQDSVVPVATIYAAGIWFGAVDPAGNLKLAATTYGQNSGNVDYFSGPINESGSTDAGTCENWDKIWSVHRYQILAHQADFTDNGVVDNPIDAIFGWPARNNANFENYNGFLLPTDDAGLAGFWDEDGDGNYTPENGDFPLPDGLSTDKIPAQILYSLFNDVGNIHQETQSDPLGIQVGQTTYSFQCEPDNPLNNTVFLSLHCTNKRFEPLDSLYFGLWIDPDLGCPVDDYSGSSPDQNSFFFYNQDNVDGIGGVTCDGIPTYGENPPVQAVTFLNQPLDNFIYFGNGFGQLPPAMGWPDSPIEHYRYLTGHWLDGTPVQTGGIGYNQGTATTNHAFPDDPNDAQGWSMTAEDLEDLDRRVLGSTYLESLAPGASERIDLAFTYVRRPGFSHLENVTAMYDDLDALQDFYDNGLTEDCEQPEICDENCLWAGDANADGIANHYDLLAIGTALGATGPFRSPPHNWSPQNAEDWAGNFANGINYKHADTDGNGEITHADAEEIELHYGLVNENYAPQPPVYSVGTDLEYSSFPSSLDLEALTPGQPFNVMMELSEFNENLYGLAFTLEFDPEFVEAVDVVGFGGGKVIRSSDAYSNENNGIDFGVIANVNTISSTSNLLWVNMKVREDLPANLVSSQLKFRDLQAIDSLGNLLDFGANPIDLQLLDVATNERASAQGFSIFPNPTTGILNVVDARRRLKSVSIFNVSGRLMLNTQATLSADMQLDLTEFPNGIYFLEMKGENGCFYEKIMVQR